MTISDKDIDRTGSDFGQHLVNMALHMGADDAVPVSYTHLDVYKRQVSSDGTLVGIVTADDVFDVSIEEATEDFHKSGACLLYTSRCV